MWVPCPRIRVTAREKQTCKDRQGPGRRAWDGNDAQCQGCWDISSLNTPSLGNAVVESDTSVSSLVATGRATRGPCPLSLSCGSWTREEPARQGFSLGICVPQMLLFCPCHWRPDGGGGDSRGLCQMTAHTGEVRGSPSALGLGVGHEGLFLQMQWVSAPPW